MFSNDEMDFSELIQSYFLKRTGKGLIFSSRDLDLLLKWEDSGCSAGTVCKGIDAAVERAIRTPRDLFACRKYIEESMVVKKPGLMPNSAQRKPIPTAKKDAPPLGEREELMGIVKRYARKKPHSDFQELYATALAELRDTCLDIDIFAFEENFYEKAFSTLPENEQKEIDDEIFKKLNVVLSTMSPKAKAATIAAKRRASLDRKMNSDE